MRLACWDGKEIFIVLIWKYFNKLWQGLSIDKM